MKRKQFVNHQKLKTWSAKKGLEIQEALFPKKLALIPLMVSEKVDFTDLTRTEDGRPRDHSSSAVQWHKEELKWVSFPGLGVYLCLPASVKLLYTQFLFCAVDSVLHICCVLWRLVAHVRGCLGGFGLVCARVPHSLPRSSVSKAHSQQET